MFAGDETELRRDIFALSAIGFFFFYTALDYVFKAFVKGKVSVLLTLLPAALLFLLLKDKETLTFLQVAVVVAVLLRIFFVFVPKREVLLTYGCFILDIAAVGLCLGFRIFTGIYYADRLLFTFLVGLTLSSIQKIFFEKNKNAFPFYYFIILCLIVSLIPMKKSPIDWAPVVNTGKRIVNTVVSAVKDASYYLTMQFDDGSYQTGYSDLKIKGDKTTGNDKLQLILRTDERPYFLYQDEETGEGMMMRRFVYLSGGRGIDKKQLVDTLLFLYENEVDKPYAELFSKVSSIEVEYVYLGTRDEIAPTNSLILTSGKENIVNGVAGKKHKKGYKLNSRFIDMDYGSPYLINLYRNADTLEKASDFDYATACSYMRKIFGTNLEDIMDAEEFDAVLNEGISDEYLDISGTDKKLADLVNRVTQGAENNYDKCKLIESYLRQYNYNTNAVGGHDPKSDMTTAAGMSDIAERFLFETSSGYCVHFASSMVMMLRLSGIPARAATGFRYGFPFEAAEQYEVGANLAHTWPEAYIEGVGWVPFEPTSAYTTAEDYSWHKKARTATVPEIEYMYNGLPPVQANPLETTEVPEEEKVTAKVFRVALPVVLSIILLILVLVLGTRGIGKLRYMLATPAKKLVLDVDNIKKGILKLSKKEFNDRGLLSDYLERAPEELRGDIAEVFRIYYKIIYGNEENVLVSPGENEMAKRLGRDLLNYKKTSRH